ncbi:hypothetical protein HYPSUDRAFT_39534 [Hypholoma sublateritium FD-334 SS-4]|uniref:Uncharacterized protein n=1 Tax=Hypholoma sublateritium (strain FD-334 SS-4) TaxID=945553 RepID=A0A0D2P505_HYPSF|nr:hypothetical protein HYPSUDRAFT_39534 [Hypholoma sublateritium FD-334 SS-4]
MTPTSSSLTPSFPSTPRLKLVALPDDLPEDEMYISNAMKASDALAEGESLGLFGMIESTPAPFAKEVERLSFTLQSMVVETSPSKIHSIFDSGSPNPASLTPLNFGRFPNGTR